MSLSVHHNASDINHIFTPQDPHPDSRSQVNIYTLHHDRSVKRGLETYDGLSIFPDRLVRPLFRNDLPPGAEGLWTILDVLCDEGEKAFANGVLVGMASLSPSLLTKNVIRKMARNTKFHLLYEANCNSEVAALLVGRMINAGAFIPPTPDTVNGEDPDVLEVWNFREDTTDLNALMKLIRLDFLRYVSSTAIFKIKAHSWRC